MAAVGWFWPILILGMVGAASPGTSVAASDDRRRSGVCYHLGERSLVFVMWAPITNHKPRASNDTDHRQQATGHQTAKMCGGGGTHILGLRRGKVHDLNINLT